MTRRADPSYDLRPCDATTVDALCAEWHGYGSGAGHCVVYSWAVYEAGRPVAAYAWKPPPPGAAAAVSAEPAGVLALSRMVAVPREARALRHVSKPMRRQMRTLIDRGRWPVLVTYSDEGQGHTGHVYRCSGWTPTVRNRVPIIEANGVRMSRYCGGTMRRARSTGHTWIQRWEHRVCEPGSERAWMEAHGWSRVVLRGDAHTWSRQAVMW